MEQDERIDYIPGTEIGETLTQIKQYLESDIRNLTERLHYKEKEVHKLKETLHIIKRADEGNKQLINKLLGDLSKLQNDIEWYKKTYEKRSFLGVIREKLFRKRGK